MLKKAHLVINTEKNTYDVVDKNSGEIIASVSMQRPTKTIIRKMEDISRYEDIKIENIEMLNKRLRERSQNSQTKSNSATKSGCIGCLGFVLIIFVIMLVFGSRGENNASKQSVDNEEMSLPKSELEEVKTQNPSFIEKLFGQFNDFEPAYTIHEIRDVSTSGAKRMSLNITVPTQLTEEILEKNLIHAAKKYYEQEEPDALVVFAYRDGDEPTGTFSAAKLMVAPDGDWSKAVSNYSIEQLETNFEISPLYYKKSNMLEVGTIYSSHFEKGDWIVLYKIPPFTLGEDAVEIEIKINSSVKVDFTILKSETKRVGQIEDTYYLVSFKYGEKIFEGWISEYEIN